MTVPYCKATHFSDQNSTIYMINSTKGSQNEILMNLLDQISILESFVLKKSISINAFTFHIFNDLVIKINNTPASKCINLLEFLNLAESPPPELLLSNKGKQTKFCLLEI